MSTSDLFPPSSPPGSLRAAGLKRWGGGGGSYCSPRCGLLPARNDQEPLQKITQEPSKKLSKRKAVGPVLTNICVEWSLPGTDLNIPSKENSDGGQGSEKGTLQTALREPVFQVPPREVHWGTLHDQVPRDGRPWLTGSPGSCPC